MKCSMTLTFELDKALEELQADTDLTGKECVY